MAKAARKATLVALVAGLGVLLGAHSASAQTPLDAKDAFRLLRPTGTSTPEAGYAPSEVGDFFEDIGDRL